MRDTTERPEAIEAGTGRLVGTAEEKIVDGVATLLTDDAVFATMATARNPYGDGRSCIRIVKAIENGHRCD